MHVIAPMICMGQDLIPVGNSPNNEDGPLSLRDVFLLINSNMVWLAQNSGGGPTNGQSLAQVKTTIASDAILKTNGFGTSTILVNASEYDANLYGTNSNFMRIWPTNSGEVLSIKDGNGNTILVGGGGSLDFQQTQVGGSIHFTSQGTTVEVNPNGLNLNGTQLSNLGTAPASGKTNVLIEKSSGVTDTYDLATLLSNGSGGSVPDPLALNSLTATNLTTKGSYNPFAGTWVGLIQGDSIMAGTFIGGQSAPYWMTNVLLPATTFTLCTNAAHSGDTINAQDAIYDALPAVYKAPAGGTNQWSLWYCGVNDITLGSNAASVIRDWSNHVFKLSSAGCKVESSPIMWEASWVDAQKIICKQVNEFILTNNMTASLFRADKLLNPIHDFSLDDVHPNTNSQRMLATRIVEGAKKPVGSLEGDGPGISGSRLDVYTDGYELQRGLGVIGQFVGPFGLARFTESGSGATAIIGSYNNQFGVFYNPSSNNVVQMVAADLSLWTSTPAMSAPGFIGVTNSFPTNSAAYHTILPAGLHSIAVNQGWTNDLGARADLILSVQHSCISPGANGGTLTFTNTVTGECWTNGIPAGNNVGYTNNYLVSVVDISPNDFGSFSNYNTAGGTKILGAWWKLK